MPVAEGRVFLAAFILAMRDSEGVSLPGTIPGIFGSVFAALADDSDFPVDAACHTSAFIITTVCAVPHAGGVVKPAPVGSRLGTGDYVRQIPQHHTQHQYK